MNIIRTDGNAVIGMGHVMRCLAIADVMEEEPVFVTACGECRKLIEERGYKAIALSTDYRRMEEELPWMRKLAAENSVKGMTTLFLVDSYQATEHYFRELRKLGRVACMEDMGISYPVDLLVNYNPYGPKLRYADGLRTLLGARYVPLRKEFAEQRDYTVQKEVKNIMITTGGGDPLFAAAGFLEAFLEGTGTDDIFLHVISGPMNQYGEELKKRYGGRPGVVIHENVSDMRSVMCRCDIALTAAGSTVYELCSQGIPMVCFYYAENQRPGAEWLAAKTDIVNAGNYAEQAAETVKRAQDAVARCIREYGYRKRLWEQERNLVDGQGAARIARALGSVKGMKIF